MAGTKEIRKRIASVKNTQQITKAMKMIAAVKLRRAQENILAARPYTLLTLDVLRSLALRADEKAHPLLAQRSPKNVWVFVVTSDRGLCGSYNSTIVRETESYIKKRGHLHESLALSFIGRRGYEYFNKRKVNIGTYYKDVMSNVTYDQAARIGEDIIAAYVEENLDAIYLIYDEFKSAISQKVIVEQLLPIKPMALDTVREEETAIDYLYEPSRKEVLNDLLPKHIKIQLYRVLLEANASEHGARMTAMDSATRNAGDMISRLTLLYNRIRQQAITTELVEIVSGAEALKA